MPCANPVARSCVKSAANAVDAIAGLSRPPGSLIYSDFMGGLGGADPLLGYSLLGGQYQDGVLVGLQPACDDLAFAGLPGVRGMRTMGQVTNLNTTSVASLALSACTRINGSGYAQIVDSVVNTEHQAYTGAAITVSAGVTYTICAEFKKDAFQYAHLQINVQTPSVVASFVGVDLIDGSYSIGTLIEGLTNVTAYTKMLSDGYVRVYLTFTTPASSTAAAVYVGPSSSKSVRGYAGSGVSAIYVRDMLTLYASPAILIPLPPGVTQTSTAHNGTSGIHYDMPQNGAVWNQLSTAKPLTLAARIVTGVGSAEIPNSTTLNIRTCRSDPSRLLRVVKDSSGNCRVELHDGTNTAQSPIITWSRYQQLIVVGQVLNGGLQMRAGAKVGAGALSFGSAVTYAGSFVPDAVYSKLMLAHSNVYPVHTLKDWLADYQSSEADILAAMGVA